MKCTKIFTKEHEEEVIIYAREPSDLIREIEELIAENSFRLVGYKEREMVNLNISEVNCFVAENNKVFALTDSDKYQLRLRLYQLEEQYRESFVKINQSSLANVRKIERFGTSISGTLTVKFKNGHKDYVSRRQMKTVKERFGI